MATLYFVRPGLTESGGHSTVIACELTIERAIAAFGDIRAHWSADEPTFEASYETTGNEEPKHVVLEVGEDEAHGKFSKAGYYTLELFRREAMARLGL